MKTRIPLMMACLLVLLACRSPQVLSGQASSEPLPAVERVLAAYLEASGGREALKGIDDRVCTGTLTWRFPDQDPSEVVIPARVFATGTDRWRLLLETSQGPQAMGYDGRDGWIQNSDRIYTDNRQHRSKLAFLFSARGPLHLTDYFPDLTLVAPGTIDRRTVYRVASRASEGPGDHLWFDAQSGLLMQIGDDIKLSDYRDVQGLTLPFRIEVARGKNTATYTFDRIELNPSLAREKTSRPTQDQVFPEAFAGLADSRVLPLLIDFPSDHEDMNVPCRDGRYLYDLIRSRDYRRGLEIGTFTGYSALWFGLALQENGGKLTTIEIDREPGEQARLNVRKAGLEAVVDVRIDDAFAAIPLIPGDFDFVFIDAWKPDYLRFLELLRTRVVPGGAIVAHNVTNHARDMQDFLTAIREDPGLETSLHEISAEGMSISFVRAQEPLSKERVLELIEMLASEDWERARNDLASAGETAVPFLIQALHNYSGHRNLPYRAALALGWIGSDQAEKALLAALQDPSTQDYVRRGVIQGLGSIGTDTASHALIRLAQDESSGISNRRAAIRALGNYPTEEVVGLLSRILRDEGSDLDYHCVQSLARIGSDAALDILIGVLKDNPEYLSGRDVLDILIEKRRDALLPILFVTLKQDSWWNWHLASEALAVMGRPAEGALIAMLHDDDAEFRRRAACVLGKTTSVAAIDPLIGLLNDTEWMVRNEALVALTRIHQGRSMQPLVEKILVEDPDARWASDFLTSPASQLGRAGYSAEIPPPAVTPHDSGSGISLPEYPQLLEEPPAWPSPVRTVEGREYVAAVTKERNFVLVPVTVENGEPYVYAQRGKGKQLAVDLADFPALGSTGLHTDAELDRTQAITGRSIAEITALGRPERSSGIGFMAQDEDIISVLRRDNRIVKAMGLTHPDLARPMFHMWNLVLEQTKAYRARQRPFADLEYFLYHGENIYFEAMEATKGWQESIFEDEIFGGHHIRLRRDLDAEEKAFLDSRYGRLEADQFQRMVHLLTHMHTGEMEPYYIMRYGFYEGHTEYRADPITIAFMFGLKSLEEIEAAFPGRLYETLTSHFIRN